MDEFFSLHDFYFLIEKTKQIQKESMRIEDAWNIIRDVADKLQKAKISAPYQKFESSLKKNTDLEQLMTRASSGDDIDFRIQMQYAPTVSSDIERSFSVTKRVLAPERCSFTTENLVKHYIIAYNH